MNELKLVMAALADTPWAIMQNTMDAVVSIVQRESIAKFEDFHLVEKSAYAALLGDRVEGTRFGYRVGNTGIISIDGPLVPRAGMMRSPSSPELASYERLTNDFKVLEDNEDVSNILFVIDSPGGAVTGLSEFGALIKASTKKVQAFVMGAAASAAYWIASSADELYSADTGLVGSIGTVLRVRDYRKADEKAGIRTFEIVSSVSPNKRRDIETDEGKAAIQRIVDQLGNTFVSVVAENRNVSVKTVEDTFGGGDVFVAPEALSRNMIDSITTLRELLLSNNSTNSITLGGPMAENNAGANGQAPQLMSAEDYKAHNAAAYASIVAIGASAERERIAALDAITHPAAQDLVAAAKADPNGSAESVKSAFAEGIINGTIKLEPSASSDDSKTEASGEEDPILKAGRALGNAADKIPSGNGATKEESEEKAKAAVRKAMVEAADNLLPQA